MPLKPSDIDTLASTHIVCVGDLMLDRFVYGSVDRISPEAPVPVFSEQKQTAMLGGVGNVARNITSLGAKVSLISVTGDDATGHEMTRIIGENDAIIPLLTTEIGRISTQKTRYVAGSQQMLRADHEEVRAIETAEETSLLNAIKSALADADCLLLSDYAKGVLTPSLVKQAITLANEANKPSFIDPKSHDFSLYCGATLISPNLKELRAAAPAGTPLKNRDDIQAAAQTLLDTYDIAHMLLTMSADGMLLLTKKAPDAVIHIPANVREVYDVSGAGDTSLATLATAFSAGLSLVDAALLANRAAGIVVGRLGTATIYRTDLKTALHSDGAIQGKHKIMPRDIAVDQIEGWRREGLTIGFTNGCYDIMHVGHAQMLNDCATECDRLIVAINSDDSVTRLKGPTRPINDEIDRAMLIANLACVDMVIIFREDTPLELLEITKPDVLMKGADYSEDKVVGGDLIKSHGGRVALIPLKEGYSTSNIVEKIRTES